MSTVTTFLQLNSRWAAQLKPSSDKDRVPTSYPSVQPGFCTWQITVCILLFFVLISSVLLFMHHSILFKFQRQVTNVPEHPVHGQVTSVTRIGKLVNILLWNYSLCTLTLFACMLSSKRNGTVIAYLVPGSWPTGLRIQSIAANMLNEQFLTSGRGWFSSLRVRN